MRCSNPECGLICGENSKKCDKQYGALICGAVYCNNCKVHYKHYPELKPKIRTGNRIFIEEETGKRFELIENQHLGTEYLKEIK